MQPRYLVEEADFINCDVSYSFEHLDYLADYMTGSKIAFQRATTPVDFWGIPSNGCEIYLHTAVLMNRCDGTGSDIIELNMDNEENSPTIKIRPASEAFFHGPCLMKVDNTFHRAL